MAIFASSFSLIYLDQMDAQKFTDIEFKSFFWALMMQPTPKREPSNPFTLSGKQALDFLKIIRESFNVKVNSLLDDNLAIMFCGEKFELHVPPSVLPGLSSVETYQQTIESMTIRFHPKTERLSDFYMSGEPLAKPDYLFLSLL